MSRLSVPLLCSLSLLAACGQSGDLYLPDEASRARAAEIQPGVKLEAPPSDAPTLAQEPSDPDDEQSDPQN